MKSVDEARQHLIECADRYRNVEKIYILGAGLALFAAIDAFEDALREEFLNGQRRKAE